MATSELPPGQKPKVRGRRFAGREEAIHEATMKLWTDKGADIMLHDNSTSNSRGWEEPLLFVPNEPQLLRPFEHTGVVVDMDGDRDIQLYINNPFVNSPYDLNNMHLNTEHSLCLVCRDVLNYFCKYEAAKDAVSNLCSKLITMQLTLRSFQMT